MISVPQLLSWPLSIAGPHDSTCPDDLCKPEPCLHKPQPQANPAVPSQKICKPCHWQPLVPMSENQKNCPCCHQQLWDPVSTRMHCRNEPRAYLRLVAMTSRLLLQRTTGHYTMFQLVAVRTDMETTFAPLKVDSWRKAHPPFWHLSTTLVVSPASPVSQLPAAFWQMNWGLLNFHLFVQRCNYQCCSFESTKAGDLS